ncbi:MAG TPA: hypothetical protein VGO00_21135 [Kofleriaceae bacterium]|nr:hypothetical protein [Kofleriaceae bacterium]
MFGALGVSAVLGSSIVVGLVLRYTVRRFPRDDEDVARAQATALAAKITSEWADDHPDRPCPHFLDELGQVLVDPWGRDYHLDCRAHDVWVTSAGPDQRFATADDITIHWSRR